jgi:hypothetical protein
VWGEFSGRDISAVLAASYWSLALTCGENFLELDRKVSPWVQTLTLNNAKINRIIFISELSNFYICLSKLVVSAALRKTDWLITSTLPQGTQVSLHQRGGALRYLYWDRQSHGISCRTLDGLDGSKLETLDRAQ